jgi:hypothetical protein
MPSLNVLANYQEYLTYTYADFNYQWLDRGDNLNQLLGPFQHDRNFLKILHQVEILEGKDS